MSGLIKLHRATSVGQITDVLRTAILRGDLQPGTALRQEDLALRIGVSRVPLREALRQLEGEGFCRTDSYRGTFVAGSTAAEALDALEVRMHLELHALGLSVKAHTPESIATCYESIERAEADPQIDEHWFEHNWAFHELLYKPANRPYLLTTIRNCFRKTQLYTWVHRKYGSRHASCREHRKILGAVASHRLAEAKKLLRQHLEPDLHTLRSDAKEALAPE